MLDQQQSNVKSVLATSILILLVVLAIISSLPSVKRWFGEQVLFWKIVNPLMALGSLYLVYDTFRSKAKIVIRLKFISALIWTGGRSLVIHEVLMYPFVGIMSTLGLFALSAFSLVDSLMASAQ